MKATTTQLYEKGYRPLVSVIPPNAQLSPNSSVKLESRGKAPGTKNANGTWSGYPWLKHEVTEGDVKKWANDNANIGICSEHFPAVDIDVLDEWMSNEIARITRDVLGWAPSRVGKAPKQLLMYRTEEPFGYLGLIIRREGDDGVYKVEILGAMRQYLIAGQHPSGSQYQWDVDLADIDPDEGLSWITKEDAEKLLAAIKDTFEMFPGYEVEMVGDGALRERTQSQSDLLAPSLTALQECVDVIPNSDDLFPHRDDYIRVGFAIKAAAGEDNEDAGYEIFASWAARHESDGRVEGNPETWHADWRRMHPPFAIGWTWLSGLAAPFGFAGARYEFEAEEAPEEMPDLPEEDLPAENSDTWLAERVIAEYGPSIRFVPESGQVFVWNSGRWESDGMRLVDFYIGSGLTRQSAIVMRRGATDRERAQNATTAKDMCSAHRRRAVRQIMESDTRVTARASAFDSDPWVLNTPGGTVDLRTGEMLPHDPDRMCSKITTVTPDVDMPTPEWDRFLDEATAGNKGLQHYLRRVVGYALTGSTKEQILVFMYGSGGNGKGTFLRAVTGIMNDYATSAPMTTFVQSDSDQHPTDMAGLMGSRLVTATETSEGRRWDEQKIKLLTGGDEVRARFMRQDFFSFIPQFLLVFAGNHKPTIRNLDYAMRRRFHIVPFTVLPKVVDGELDNKLREEWPGILAWMLRGCLEWQKDGLTPPEMVVEATEQYFEDQDPVGRWIEERCVEADEATTLMDLFNSWEEWSNARGERAMSARWLQGSLETRGYYRDTINRKTAIRGLKLNNTELEEALP